MPTFKIFSFHEIFWCLKKSSFHGGIFKVNFILYKHPVLFAIFPIQFEIFQSLSSHAILVLGELFVIGLIMRKHQKENKGFREQKKLFQAGNSKFNIKQLKK